MSATKISKPKPMKFYELEIAVHSYPWEIVNENRLLPEGTGLESRDFNKLWPDGVNSVTRGPWTIPDYLEQPHIVIDKKKAKSLVDFYLRMDFMFISAKLKTLIEDVAPGSCDFRPCRTEYSDGTPAPEMWMGSVTRVLKNVIDLTRSRLRRRWGGGVDFDREDGFVYFCKDTSQARLFQTIEMCGRFVCDENFRARCKEEGIRGIQFGRRGELSE